MPAVLQTLLFLGHIPVRWGVEEAEMICQKGTHSYFNTTLTFLVINMAVNAFSRCNNIRLVNFN